MLGHTGNRRAPWGQLYHWVKQGNGKLKFVAGLEPIAGVEFSTERPVTEGPGFYIRDKDGPVDLEKLQAQHLLFGGSGNAVD